jgi:hypothetical protein
MRERNLFMVEFGSKDATYGHDTVYVIAKDYNEAANKGMLYADNKECEKQKNVLDSDNSLNPWATGNKANKVIEIKGIKFLGNVIW